MNGSERTFPPTTILTCFPRFNPVNVESASLLSGVSLTFSRVKPTELIVASTTSPGASEKVDASCPGAASESLTQAHTRPKNSEALIPIMLYLKSAELTFGLSPMAPVDRQSVLRFLTHELLRQE